MWYSFGSAAVVLEVHPSYSKRTGENLNTVPPFEREGELQPGKIDTCQ
jgi:hypothetical protein